ncbi:MAG: (2Fe-2S)-binding protein, partial [Rhodobacteraceae bacterium]|nr:(2Fe-2S)-binding protein [Paracoccaceae bacterium]
KNPEFYAKWLYPLAVLIPVLALLGYVEGGRQVLAENLQPKTETSAPAGGAYTSTPAKEKFVPARPPAEIIKTSKQAGKTVMLSALALMVLTMIARYIRIARNKGHMVEVVYSSGPRIEAETGPTLLDITRLNYMPHANMCRGRGRCGTCRVKIVASDAALAPPSPLEQNTLDRLEAQDGVRLACQLVPGPGTIHIERLVSPDYSLKEKDEAEAEAGVVEATS